MYSAHHEGDENQQISQLTQIALNFSAEGRLTLRITAFLCLIWEHVCCVPVSCGE